MNDENLIKLNDDQMIAIDSNQCSEDDEEWLENNSSNISVYRFLYASFNLLLF